MQSSENKYLIVLITHKWGSRIEAMYDDFKSIHDTIILADEAYKNEYNFPEESILFNKNDFELAKYKGKYKTFINNFNPFFMIYDKLIEYDYVYMVEYDVECLGDWCDFFKKTDNIKEDLILSTINTNSENIKDLSPLTCPLTTDAFYADIESQNTGYIYIVKDQSKIDKKLIDIPSNYYTKGLHCFSRYSRELLKMLYEELPHYQEFFEILVPTLALYHGFSITGLNQKKHNLVGYFYALDKGGLNLSFNDFDKIHHPIKSTNLESGIDLTKKLINCLDKICYEYDEYLLNIIIIYLLIDKLSGKIDRYTTIFKNKHLYSIIRQRALVPYIYHDKCKLTIINNAIMSYIDVELEITNDSLLMIIYLIKEGHYIPEDAINIIINNQRNKIYNEGIYINLLSIYFNSKYSDTEFKFNSNNIGKTNKFTLNNENLKKSHELKIRIFNELNTIVNNINYNEQKLYHIKDCLHMINNFMDNDKLKKLCEKNINCECVEYIPQYDSKILNDNKEILSELNADELINYKKYTF